MKPLRTTMRSAAMSSRFFGNVYAGTSQPCSRSPAETSKTEKGCSPSTTNAKTGSWVPSVSRRNGPRSAIAVESCLATARQESCTRR